MYVLVVRGMGGEGRQKKMGELTQKWEVHTLLCELTHFCVNRSLCQKELKKKMCEKFKKCVGYSVD